MTERWTPFVAYLSKELGVKVNLRIANDYAAVIEGQRAGNIHIALLRLGLVRARAADRRQDRRLRQSTSMPTAPRAIIRCSTCMAKSPYKKLDELKGKNLGLVDPNSTSGNNMPRFELEPDGRSTPTLISGKVVFTGSHENAVLALAQGTVDVAAN